MQQRDAGRTVWVVLDRGDARRHACLCGLPVDQAVEPLVAAALVPDRQLPLAVAAGMLEEPFGERLVRHVGGDLVKCGPRHLAQARARRSITSQGHPYTASKSS